MARAINKNKKPETNNKNRARTTTMAGRLPKSRRRWSLMTCDC
jgi:hypothetical protein